MESLNSINTNVKNLVLNYEEVRNKIKELENVRKTLLEKVYKLKPIASSNTEIEDKQKGIIIEKCDNFAKLLNNVSENSPKNVVSLIEDIVNSKKTVIFYIQLLFVKIFLKMVSVNQIKYVLKGILKTADTGVKVLKDVKEEKCVNFFT